MKNRNEIFLITGTRKGLGQSLALHYLQTGKIVIGCSRNNASIEHKNYTHFKLDVSDEKEVQKMIRVISKRHKKVDVLINNAGIALMNHVLLTAKSSVNDIFNTNFLGTFLFIREASRLMIKNKYGRIVNFSTVAVPLNLEGEAIYASSKSAVETFTRVSSKELGQFGITVNAIGPSPVLTDLIRLVPKEKIDSLIESQAIKRFGETEDILNVVDFFINEKSDFITGQTIYLGGIS
ncbi:MAG: SDR family oxidoreductase [Roseivirga sp.]|nr:SDR family oxidoreductase [Roseivirga sp.]